jgi:hypothetical protein
MQLHVKLGIYAPNIEHAVLYSPNAIDALRQIGSSVVCPNWKCLAVDHLELRRHRSMVCWHVSKAMDVSV